MNLLYDDEGEPILCPVSLSATECHHLDDDMPDCPLEQARSEAEDEQHEKNLKEKGET